MFAVDLINALHYLHSSGVLFCDLKPSNILLNENGVLKLADFALAQQVRERTALRKGSPMYMAPELFRKPGLPTFASELWALGCVLHELAFGYPPFSSVSAQSFHELVHSVLHEPVKLKADDRYGQAFVGLLGGLLRKSLEARMGWAELVQHPFWEVDVPSEGQALVLPSVEDMVEIDALQSFMRDNKAVVDSNEVLRLSRNAKRNRRRESLENGSKWNLKSDENLLYVPFADSIEIDEGGVGLDGTSGDLCIEHADTQLDFRGTAGRTSVETDDSDVDVAFPVAEETPDK